MHEFPWEGDTFRVNFVPPDVIEVYYRNAQGRIQVKGDGERPYRLEVVGGQPLGASLTPKLAMKRLCTALMATHAEGERRKARLKDAWNDLTSYVRIQLPG